MSEKIELGYAPVGSFVEISGKVTPSKIDDAKNVVLEEVIKFIRHEAMTNPNFFIIKRKRKGCPLSMNSVGAKVYVRAGV